MPTIKPQAKKPKTVASSKAPKALPAKAKKPAAKKPAAPKKKLGNAIPKKPVIKASKNANDHWFAKLSKKAQADYIKSHPNSKFAKGAKAGAAKTVKVAKVVDTRKNERAAIRKEMMTHRATIRNSTKEIARIAKDESMPATKRKTAMNRHKAVGHQASSALKKLQAKHAALGKKPSKK